jgi:Rrf2 family protein
MHISKSAQYALQAMLCLSAFKSLTSARVVAESLSLPANFLSKTLQQLERHGLVNSQPGPKGGFILARPPETIALLEIIEALDGKSLAEECYLGLGSCGNLYQCPIHEECSMGNQRLRLALSRSTLQSLLEQNRSSTLVRKMKRGVSENGPERSPSLNVS